MGNVDRITTFFDVEEGDFAVSMPDDTMHNPSGSPSIPVGATVILRPGESYKNGSIVAVIVPKGRAAEAAAYSKGKLSLNPELYKKKDTTQGEGKGDS